MEEDKKVFSMENEEVHESHGANGTVKPLNEEESVETVKKIFAVASVHINEEADPSSTNGIGSLNENSFHAEGGNEHFITENLSKSCEIHQLPAQLHNTNSIMEICNNSKLIAQTHSKRVSSDLKADTVEYLEKNLKSSEMSRLNSEDTAITSENIKSKNESNIEKVTDCKYETQNQKHNCEELEENEKLISECLVDIVICNTLENDTRENNAIQKEEEDKSEVSVNESSIKKTEESNLEENETIDFMTNIQKSECIKSDVYVSKEIKETLSHTEEEKGVNSLSEEFNTKESILENERLMNSFFQEEKVTSISMPEQNIVSLEKEKLNLTKEEELNFILENQGSSSQKNDVLCSAERESQESRQTLMEKKTNNFSFVEEEKEKVESPSLEDRTTNKYVLKTYSTSFLNEQQMFNFNTEKPCISNVFPEKKVSSPGSNEKSVSPNGEEKVLCYAFENREINSLSHKEIITFADMEDKNFVHSKEEIKNSVDLMSSESNQYTGNEISLQGNNDFYLSEAKDICKIENSHNEKIEMDTTVSISTNDSSCSGSSKNEDIAVNKYSQVTCSQTLNSLSNTVADPSEASKSENDGSKIMDVEVIDLSENDIIKDKNINQINRDDADPNAEYKFEKLTEQNVLTSNSGKKEDEKMESSLENQNDYLLLDKGSLQGQSVEKIITGDIVRKVERNEDVCIMPDDLICQSPFVNKSKPSEENMKKRNLDGSEKSDIKLIEHVSDGELEKAMLKDEEIDQNDILKSEHTRNAAKLPENKIISLVASESEPQSLNSDAGDQRKSKLVDKEESWRTCAQCKEVIVRKFFVVQGDVNHYLCSEKCSEVFAKAFQAVTDALTSEVSTDKFVRKCSHCHGKITLDDKCLFWETMDFCDEECLEKYQNKLGSNCINCREKVGSSSLGKFCVRFGCDVKQFCSGPCLEEFKKGLKVCSYCHKDMSAEIDGFMAPVGDRSQFKDFCTQSCMEKYDQLSNHAPARDVKEECSVCSKYKPVSVEVDLDNKTHKLCSEPCFAAFKFVNNVSEGQCDMCKKYFDRTKIETLSVFYEEGKQRKMFCGKTCMNVYILARRKIMPCTWCKVKKYNFDMIKKNNTDGQSVIMCSLNCLTLYESNRSALTHTKCDSCSSAASPQYHLIMSDGSLRKFCSDACATFFQNQYPKPEADFISGGQQLNSPVSAGLPSETASKRPRIESTSAPIITSVESSPSSSAVTDIAPQCALQKTDVGSQVSSVPSAVACMPALPAQTYQKITAKPPPAKKMRNKSILCKPFSHTKGVSCRPHPCIKETQTDQSLSRKFLIPIPVPIYVPCPMHMFSSPFPVPVPFALPVPVPIFIPTTRNSAKGIMKEIKRIQEKIPTDPFEAELLMMAEIVAGEKKQEATDSESEDGNEGEDGEGTFSPDNVDPNNTFGDDVLQMALKMASELEEPAVDMESVLTSNTITTQVHPAVDSNKTMYGQVVTPLSVNRGRKRAVRGSRNNSGGTPNKRGRRASGSVDVPLLPPPEPVPPPRIEVEKPDADMCLKYTFGVNAWRHWVIQKNAELEKVAMTNRKIKLFKPELLQLTADELNFSLCLFVKEVRKPNGTEYAPDTIYYLCLGIQQYLFENGRIDNIFTDSYYEKFTDCLDEVAKKFASLYNDSQYIVTRVEEEHLWESKQLGAHSPHVLLSTLMFFNTKHFNLVTVEEHMQLSFSHIMKHWKRNPNSPGVAKIPGSRNVLLRFYPPQSALEANSRKKKVYEQQENEENPLRCPVKLYEFYLSKCPESVKTRNDVFYLLPERSCVPDSPVWYSTMALGKEPLMKMLHRVKMVKEINIALLSC